jgi:carbon monoxide dehydrogenase subunit G
MPFQQDRARHDLQVRRGRGQSWRRLDGPDRLQNVIPGVKFIDRNDVIRSQAQAAAA